MISIWCLPNRFRPFCPRFLSSKSRSQKYTLKKLKQREEYQNEITTNPEFENEVELLSQTLMNDTKGLVSSTLTHSHKKIRENLKAAIIFRKNFNSPMESSILTWKAKEQVLHLSSVDSSEWNADIISQYFPISKEGTKKMIAKSKKEPQRMFRSLEGVIQHDSRCILRWKNILEVIVSAQFEGKIKANLSEILNEVNTQIPMDLRWISSKAVLDHLLYVNGNPSLPFPPKSSLEILKESILAHQPGPFQQIAEQIQKPLKSSVNYTSIRNQQLVVVDKIVSLFKSQDFSSLTNLLIDDTSAKFDTVFRNWLYMDNASLQLPEPKFQRIKSLVDCDFTKYFRYKRIDV